MKKKLNIIASEPDERIIQELEQLLTEARAGKFTGIAYCLNQRGEQQWRIAGEYDKAQILLATQCLILDMLGAKGQ